MTMLHICMAPCSQSTGKWGTKFQAPSMKIPPHNSLMAPSHPAILVSPFPMVKHTHPCPSKYSITPLCPHVSGADFCLHWLTPYGLGYLNKLSSHLPYELITPERVVLVRAIVPTTLSNYGAGLLRCTQFCDSFKVAEDLHMPVLEWLLSVFVTTMGASSVGGSTIRTWLLGLQLWHMVNVAPWHGTPHLKRAMQGSASVASPFTLHPR